jgi:hypothetical protein
MANKDDMGLRRIIASLRRFLAAYGISLLLAMLIHAALIGLLTLKITATPQPAAATPIASYLYQPEVIVIPKVMPADATLQPIDNNQAHPGQARIPAVKQRAAATPAKPGAQALKSVPVSLAEGEAAAENAAETLADRAIRRAVSTTADMAGNSYQQFISDQQQPKITVEKRYQALSADPAKQVVAQLNDGRQILRTKDGCQLSDPTKHGFDAMMAVKKVPCGDEVSTDDLLKQALQKHSRR